MFTTATAPLRFSLKLSNGSKIFQAQSQPIGSGAQGTVYLFHDQSGTEYAVKRLSIDVQSPTVSSSVKEKDFFKEVNGFCERLIYLEESEEEGEEDKCIIYLVMPLLEGTTLRSLLSEATPAEKSILCACILPETKIQLQDKKIDHRDLTDENILINKKNKKIYFIDFGLSENFGENFSEPYYLDTVILGEILEYLLKIKSFEGLEESIIEDLKAISDDLIKLRSSPSGAFNSLLTVFLEKIGDYKDQIRPDFSFFLIQSLIKMKKNSEKINTILEKLNDPQSILTSPDGMSLFEMARLNHRHDLIKSWIIKGWLPKNPLILSKFLGSCLQNNLMEIASLIINKQPRSLNNLNRVKDDQSNNILHYLFNHLETKNNFETKKHIYTFIENIFDKYPELFFEENINHLTPRLMLKSLDKRLSEVENPEEIDKLFIKNISKKLKAYDQYLTPGLSVFASKNQSVKSVKRKDMSSPFSCK